MKIRMKATKSFKAQDTGEGINGRVARGMEFFVGKDSRAAYLERTGLAYRAPFPVAVVKADSPAEEFVAVPLAQTAPSGSPTGEALQQLSSGLVQVPPVPESKTPKKRGRPRKSGQ